MAMFIVTAKLTKRKAVSILIMLAAVAVVIAILVGFLRETGKPSYPSLDSNEMRLAWIGEWGWEVDSEPVETLQLQLPDQLPESYEVYNDLQKEQGFDLADACGQQVTRYTYTVTNYPGRAEGVQLNLYLCDGTPVAGDILCSGEDGFQTGLEYPASEETLSPAVS
jgi:hypothetical protein